MPVPLRELAHCRAGDKGNLATLSVFPYDDALFGVLLREVTAERVRGHLAEWLDGEVRRYELPHLPALQFVCERTSGAGVTTSLELDTHGKTLGTLLLSLPVHLGHG
ncbi:AtuA-related protein [Prauserella flavalba]|uniref:AtuA-related protein n=1 Tax=Prauserella flavalba TaxID=1477506 RepID=UPI0036E92E05